MKLSVITINRNNACGLEKTIQSVLGQSFRDYEYIIIDGNSNDDSVAIINKYSSKIAYWVSEPDSGVYNAMNKGIKQAKGEYLLFLNSGDFLLNKNVLSDLFSHKIFADIVCAKCNVSDNGKVVWTSNPPKHITLGTLYYVGLAHQSTFIKRELFATIGLYREDFKYNSDIEFWYRAFIFNNATSQSIDLITTDYNLDGISSQDNKTSAYMSEMKEIISRPPLQMIIPDYDRWREERKSMEILYWAKTKRIIYNPIKWIYKLMKFIRK